MGQRSPVDYLIGPAPAASVGDTIAGYEFELLHIGAAGSMDEICEAVVGVTTLGFIAGEAYIASMAALQVTSAVSAQDRDAIDEMTNGGVAWVLPHAWSSRTKRPHSSEDSGRMMVSRER